MCLEKIKRTIRKLTGVNGIDRRVHEIDLCQQEMSAKIRETQQRNDGLMLLVRGMRNKEDWGNG